MVDGEKMEAVGYLARDNEPRRNNRNLPGRSFHLAGCIIEVRRTGVPPPPLWPRCQWGSTRIYRELHEFHELPGVVRLPGSLGVVVVSRAMRTAELHLCSASRKMTLDWISTSRVSLPVCPIFFSDCLPKRP